MNKFFALLLSIVVFSVNAQDTTCVMITLDEIIYFDYYTSEIIDRQSNNEEITLRVESDEVLCIHFLDEKKRFRDVTTTWDDGDHRHDTFSSKDEVLYSPFGFGGIEIEVSTPRKRK